MSRVIRMLSLLVILLPFRMAAEDNFRFRSLKVSNPDNFMSPPVLRLGTDDRISINFDEIGDDYSELRYRLIHCDADWKRSVLTESEYIGGFNEEDVSDYAFSSNTFIHYVNYQITLPSETAPILRSGNYLLEVYERDFPEETLLSVPFMVSENLAKVKGEVSGRTDRGFNTEWQQLNLTVELPSDLSGDAYRDMKVFVSQNGADATRRQLAAPSRKSGNVAFYEHLRDLIFPAGNEYRRFENVSTAFPGLNTDSIRFVGPGYHVWVKKDTPLNEADYVFDSTQRGRSLIKEYNASDSNLGADYVTAHFFLETPKLNGGEVYIDGEMTHGVFNDHNRMRYNAAKGGYELEMPLKQGSYNYRYVVKYADGTLGFSAIDGNKYETRNEYWVAVYYREPGSRADRLIGFSCILPV